MKASTVKRGLNIWPPLLFSGIKVTHIADDFKAVTVELRQKWYNKNVVGVHFGGSIFAMTDPFFMFMLMNNLNKDYTVWDRAGSIDFIKPGKGTIKANFILTNEMLKDIKSNTIEEGSKFTPTYSVDVIDAEGVTVAHVTKTMHIRKRKDKRKRIL